MEDHSAGKLVPDSAMIFDPYVWKMNEADIIFDVAYTIAWMKAFRAFPE